MADFEWLTSTVHVSPDPRHSRTRHRAMDRRKRTPARSAPGTVARSMTRRKRNTTNRMLLCAKSSMNVKQKCFRILSDVTHHSVTLYTLSEPKPHRAGVSLQDLFTQVRKAHMLLIVPCQARVQTRPRSAAVRLLGQHVAVATAAFRRTHGRSRPSNTGFFQR